MIKIVEVLRQLKRIFGGKGRLGSGNTLLDDEIQLGRI